MTADTEMDMAACTAVANVWISRNVAAFPIAISKNGKGYAKRPLTPHGHTDATLDKSTANELFALASMDLREGEVLGVGIVPGPAGYAVADLDVHGDGKNGVQAADDLLMGIENTYAPVTISGGAHAWFTKPDPDQHITNGSPWARLGIDIRGDNGWTVAPGTITPWGSWAPITGTPTFDAIKPFPESLWNELVAHQCNGKVKVNLPTGPLPNPGDVALGDQLAGLLSDLGPWPDGDGEHRDRSRRFHYLVGEMKRHGHSIEDTTAVLTPWCNALDKYTGRVPEMVAASWAKVDGPPVASNSQVVNDANMELVLPAEFWCTNQLQAIRTAAHSAQLGSAGLLGAVLARVSMQTHYSIELPRTRNRGSLNLLVGLVVASGGGKGSSVEVAEHLLPGASMPCHCRDHEEGDYITLPPGSGEGLTRSYYDNVAEGKGNQRKWRRDRHHVLIDVDEIESLLAISTRSGATIGPTLRSMWSGGRAGFNNSSAERRFPLAPGSYRTAMVAGIQPSVVARLFDQETSGGSPQRFLWAPAHSRDIPNLDAGEVLPDMPPQLDPVQMEAIGEQWAPYGITVDPEVQREVDLIRNRISRRVLVRGPLDSHREFLRLRVAALLARLHLEREVTPQWWALAGMVMDLSDDTRADMLAAVGEQDREKVRSAGVRDHIRRVAATEEDVARIEGAAKSMCRVVVKHSEQDGRHPEGTCARRCVMNGVSSRFTPTEKADALQLALDKEWLTESGDRFTPGTSRPA